MDETAVDPGPAPASPDVTLVLPGKICTSCALDLPRSAFAANRRHSTGLQSQCRRCQRANYNTPAYKARRRRMTGQVSVPYLTREERLAAAAKRSLDLAGGRQLRNAELAERASARDAEIRSAEVGSPKWLATAPAEHLAIFERVQAMKAQRAQQQSGRVSFIKLRGRFAIGEHELAVVDAEDADRLTNRAWKAKPNGSGSGIYAVRNRAAIGCNWTERMHREVLGLGNFDGLEVDHIDGNTLNNRMSNLRLATRPQNARNTRRLRALAPVTPSPLP